MRKIPTHLKLLRGNPGKRPLHPEPQPPVPPSPPEAPSFLVGYSMDEWYRVAEELHRLKLLTVIDIHPLAAYCQAYGYGARQSKPSLKSPSVIRPSTA